MSQIKDEKQILLEEIVSAAQHTAKYNPLQDKELRNAQQVYSTSITDPKTNQSYTLQLYKRTDTKYNPTTDYLLNHKRSKSNFTNRVPGKIFETFTDGYAGPGLLGYTFLISGYQALNDKLYTNPELKDNVDVHEAIHTDDEYETRVITEWMFTDDDTSYAVVVSYDKDEKENNDYDK